VDIFESTLEFGARQKRSGRLVGSPAPIQLQNELMNRNRKSPSLLFVTIIFSSSVMFMTL
jgi:hypothetical protein